MSASSSSAVARVRAQVRRTIEQRKLFATGASVLVACSGGPDSQVLLHVLSSLARELELTLCAASVNHGLRADAEHDVAIAGELAGSLSIPFHALRVTVSAGASRQAQARIARYRALLACAAEQGAQCVAVGHTLDDQAETVLDRVLRGTSIDGLAGIIARRPDGVVRPLIDVERAEIHAYVAEKQLTFATDPSNTDPRFRRARVRSAVLPVLSREHPRVAQHLAALAEDASDLRELLAAASRHALLRAGGDFRSLKEESPLVRRSALKHHVQTAIGIALRRTHLVALDRMLSNGGQVRLPGDYVASLGERGELVLEPVTKRGRGE